MRVAVMGLFGLAACEARFHLHADAWHVVFQLRALLAVDDRIQGRNVAVVF